jgi:transcriptional activator of cad operon
MEPPAGTTLRIGDWGVHPGLGQISRDGETVRVEMRSMRLLLCLAGRSGEVVSIDDLLNQVWPDVTVAPDSVYQAVASLRRLLGDDPKQPTYIATVPRLGYRMVATVTPIPTQPIVYDGASPAVTAPAADTPMTGPEPESGKRRFPGTAIAWIAVAVMGLAVIVAFALHSNLASSYRSAAASRPQKSIAVLPFLDLTEGMKNEEFADGITEELIDRLSRIPGLRVPSATSSFYFKDKQVPISDIARVLSVAYALDGSVRKSGTWVRVDVRLIRADTGYVVWSETYDQPSKDILTIQDDIAGKATKALRASIDATP